MNYSNYGSKMEEQERVSHSCPVCKAPLGSRPADEEKSMHCTECRAWYTWFPGINKPTAKLDRDMPNPCNCDGCKARRGELD